MCLRPGRPRPTATCVGCCPALTVSGAREGLRHRAPNKWAHSQPVKEKDRVAGSSTGGPSSSAP